MVIDMTELELEKLSDKVASKVATQLNSDLSITISEQVERALKSHDCLCGIPVNDHKEFHHLVGGLGIDCERGAGISTRKVYNLLLFTEDLNKYYKYFFSIASKVLIVAIVGGLIAVFVTGFNISFKDTKYATGRNPKPEIRGIVPTKPHLEQK